jgi:cytidylate kinase
MSEQSKVVAIDGPSGSGKSTLAKELAAKLGFLYIDTGAMYRGIGLTAQLAGVDFVSGQKLQNFLQELSFEYGRSADELIVINGKNLTQATREHHVSKLASDISKLPEVRTYLLSVQQSLGKKSFSVMEGRDIGTVVFPDAFLKIYLTASAQERAKRRVGQLKELGQEVPPFEQVLQDVIDRDHNDMTREIAPLKQARDAVLLDSTSMSRVEVLQTMEELVQKRCSELGW